MSNLAPFLVILCAVGFLALCLSPVRKPRKPQTKKPARKKVTKRNRK